MKKKKPIALGPNESFRPALEDETGEITIVSRSHYRNEDRAKQVAEEYLEDELNWLVILISIVGASFMVGAVFADSIILFLGFAICVGVGLFFRKNLSWLSTRMRGRFSIKQR